MTHIQKRLLINKIVLILSTLSALIGLGFLAWILYVLVANGIDALNLNIFIYEGAPPGYLESGLKQALVGQLILVVVATGIVVGSFVYAIIVIPTGHFSGWAGVAALVIIMIPIVLRTTDDMLQLVPVTLREAAFALGAPKYKVILQVVIRGAKAGILTGILLAVARVGGETAPLLFTSFNDNFMNYDLSQPMASLTVTMFNYATSPYEDWQKLGWAAAFILSMFVLGLNIIGRLMIFKKRR
jgi:phosphate transport system permease protein